MRWAFLGTMGLAAALCGCGSRTTTTATIEPTTQVYRHKYGIELSREEWEARGEDGVVTTRKPDGVTIAESFAGGTLHGLRTISFPHRETPNIEETFEHGQLVKRVIHDPTGFPVSLEEFLGEEQRQVTYWYTSGAPQRVEQHDGRMITAAECFALKTGELEAKVADGVGTLLCRDPFGTLLSEAMVQDGQVVQLVTYYPNGTPQELAHYRDGQLNGQRTLYTATGMPEKIESWESGVQQGTTIVYDNGIKIAEVPYVDGERHGTEHRLNTRGEVTQEIGWLHNERLPSVR